MPPDSDFPLRPILYAISVPLQVVIRGHFSVRFIFSVGMFKNQLILESAISIRKTAGSIRH